MQEETPATGLTRLLRRLALQDRLRASAGLRATFYLSGAALLLRSSRTVFDRADPWALEGTHMTTVPFATAWTWMFVRLREEDIVAWYQLLGNKPVENLLKGIGIGSGTYLTALLVASRLGWVYAPAWGWKTSSPHDVAVSMVWHVAGHGAIAWNEEIVFRGYGLDTLTEAVGRRTALALLVGLFAVGHGLTPQIIAGHAAGGLAMSTLRLTSGSLVQPIGYHFAWNYLQTAVFGPPNAPPSLRPLQISGPREWLGQPGSPESGLLFMLVELAVALTAASAWRRRARHRYEN